MTWTFCDTDAVIRRAKDLEPSLDSSDYEALDGFLQERATEIRSVLDERGLAVQESWADDDTYGELWTLASAANAMGALADLYQRFNAGSTATDQVRDARAEYRRLLDRLRVAQYPGLTEAAAKKAVHAKSYATTNEVAVSVTKDMKF